MEQPIVIDNIESLKKRIVTAGFGNRFDKDIEDALALGKSEIRPFTSEVIENKRIDFEPEIKIKEGKGYFNGFKATLHNEDGTAVNQWFKAGDRISMDEAFILMMDQKYPRAILKTFYNESQERYNQWVQIDFTRKTESNNHLTKHYNDFDQVSKLNDYDFIELSSVKQKATAAAYMSEGREVEVTPVNQTNVQVVYIRANPERNTFTFLSSEGKLLSHDQFRTDAAKLRAQEEKSTKQSSVSFVKDAGAAATEAIPQGNSDPSKKKDRQDAAVPLKSSKRQRVIQANEQGKGKSI